MRASFVFGAPVVAVVLAAFASCGGRTEIPLPPPTHEETFASATPVATSPPAPKVPDAGVPMPPAKSTSPTLAEDLAFLKEHGAVHVLEAKDGGRVVVSAKYQGRVMTSAVAESGRSCGWIHRDFIASAKTGTQFDNFGGEDRLWLGPEGGQYGLYFPKGSAFAFDAWQVPHAMQEGAWEMPLATAESVVFKKSMKLANWTGTTFDVEVERKVELVGKETLDKANVTKVLSEGVQLVAFQTVNKITNAGASAWKRETGLPSIWILAMYAPAADGRAIVPFRTDAPKGTPVANDAYFGKVPDERLKIREDKGFLTFVVDGKHRSKIGVGPRRAKNVLGSYSAEAKLLTIVEYEPAADLRKAYVNSMWEKQKEPYGGDVVNSYNDGPPAPGKPPLGGFYELETSSPGAELAPRQSLVHRHRTYHFVGERDALDPIAKQLLGVSLAEIGAPTGSSTK